MMRGGAAGARLARQCARAAQFHRTRQAAGARAHGGGRRSESARASRRAPRRAKSENLQPRRSLGGHALREAGGNISRAAQSLGTVAAGLVPAHGTVQPALRQAAPERLPVEPQDQACAAADRHGRGHGGAQRLGGALVRQSAVQLAADPRGDALLPLLLAGIAASCGRCTQMLRALSGTVASYREGDFSLSLVADRDDELGELMTAHNELAEALREQRAHLVQRELLLDTVMQNSPVALVLVDANERVAYANIAARHLLSGGRSLQGLRFQDALREARRRRCRGPRQSRATVCFPPRSTASRRPFTSRSAPSSCRDATSAVSAQAPHPRALAPGSFDLEEADPGLEPRAQQLPGSLVLAGAFRRRNRAARRLRGAARRVLGHRGARRAPAPIRQRLCRIRQAACASAGIGSVAAVRRGPARTADLYLQRTVARAARLVRSRAGGAGADQYAQERARSRRRRGRGGAVHRRAAARISASKCAIAAPA